MVDHTFIFSPPVRKIKEIVDSGELGDLYYIDSVRINLGLSGTTSTWSGTGHQTFPSWITSSDSCREAFRRSGGVIPTPISRTWPT